jgi:CheY-like chemotaxis protein
MSDPYRSYHAPILLAEDDPDDRFLMARAVEQNELSRGIAMVADGEELLDYLFHRGRYADPDQSPRPCLILLDLNMPRKDGREALREIKDSPELRRIPVVILTTSAAEEDIIQSYDLGVNAFITKPATFEDLRQVILSLRRFWFETVRLPLN